MTFKQFMQALPLLAEGRGCDEKEVRGRGLCSAAQHSAACLPLAKAPAVHSAPKSPPPPRVLTVSARLPSLHHAHRPSSVPPSPAPQVRMLVAAASGPVRRGTVPQQVKFHDAPSSRWGKT